MTENPLIRYGTKLQELREDAKLTQDQASSLIGVSKTSLRNWEKGRKLPTVENLNELMRVYKVSSDDIHFIDSLYFMSRKELIKTLAEVIKPQAMEDE